MASNDQILTLSCPDKPGIVHAVTGIFARHGHNIADLQQFSDGASQRFFMRVHFEPRRPSSDAAEGQEGQDEDPSSVEHLTAPLEELRARYDAKYELHPVARKTRVMIMVSKIGHCLNDLLFRMKTGQLNIEVPLIVSNHAEFKDLAASYNIPFHHLPVTAATKPAQEAQVLALAREHEIDLVALARYMQILSPSLCAALPGRIINIHHSFLPSFKGARPYHQAHDRGVKIIGATAHFATADLDEGPIIEQTVVKIDHGMGPARLTAEGSNVESVTLATAVRLFSERRIFVNGIKTVVFS